MEKNWNRQDDYAIMIARVLNKKGRCNVWINM